MAGTRRPGDRVDGQVSVIVAFCSGWAAAMLISADGGLPMGWLDRLLARHAGSVAGEAAASEPVPTSGAAQAGQTSHRISWFGDRIASIGSLDIMGCAAESANGRFTLIWQDAARVGTADDARGRFVLLDDGIVRVDRRMERPHGGQVTDEGVFVVVDWGLRSDLAGNFHAFDSDGRCLVEVSYSANILNCGLAPNGGMAACQTCNSPDSADSSVLEIFDLETGVSVGRLQPESGWAEGYEFVGRDVIRLMYRGKPSRAYRVDGEFLDRREWLRDEVAGGSLRAARIAFGDLAYTGLDHDDLVVGLKHAVRHGEDRFLAETWRLLGEVQLEAGRPAEALSAWDEALAINPKIGVAKRASALRSAVAVSQT